MKKSITKLIASITACAAFGLSAIFTPMSDISMKSYAAEKTIPIEEFFENATASEYQGLYYDAFDNEAFIYDDGSSIVLWKVYGDNGKYNRGQAVGHISSGQSSTGGSGFYATLSNGYYMQQGQWLPLNNESVTFSGYVTLSGYGHYQKATIHIFAPTSIGTSFEIQRFEQQ